MVSMCDLQIGLSETSTKAKDPLREFNTRNVPQGSEKGLKKKHNTSTLRGVALTHLRSDARIFSVLALPPLRASSSGFGLWLIGRNSLCVGLPLV